MTTVRKFFPGGRTTITKEFINNCIDINTLTTHKKPNEIPCNCYNSEDVYKMWQNMGSPACTVYMCGYMIIEGKIVN